MTKERTRRGTVRLLALCDNTSSSSGLGKEWGLSLAITLPGARLWIFDTGQTPLFLTNAQKLGLALDTAQGVVLSHGHYDHTGGLWALLERLQYKGPVYGHPFATRARYSLKKGSPARSIGMPFKALSQMSTFVEIQKSRELDDGLTFFTDIGRIPGNFEPVQGFYFDEEGTQPDTIRDDSFLLAETPKGPVAIMGCCHSGLANSLLHLREQTGVDKLHAVVGGLHLGYASPAALDETADILRQFSVEVVYAGHCTGDRAAARLSQALPGVIQGLGSGRTISFG
ncbi:MAG: 7,8-dihydropterin-6-yl-methyl-4-(beta-D-ribofuranosyl)aminobenzene 5-phosphate synthase [Desulfovibrionales bacterium]|nr:7,8-dihydropterin-6-yl-methyl-4-(beta-D-ribofuranosyl)aminobenzene 5-phosphate synthase [Desulfovibrionales bacterium]